MAKPDIKIGNAREGAPVPFLGGQVCAGRIGRAGGSRAGRRGAARWTRSGRQRGNRGSVRRYGLARARAGGETSKVPERTPWPDRRGNGRAGGGADADAPGDRSARDVRAWGLGEGSGGAGSQVAGWLGRARVADSASYAPGARPRAGRPTAPGFERRGGPRRGRAPGDGGRHSHRGKGTGRRTRLWQMRHPGLPAKKSE